ncbi:hypothetical protein [Pseudomonas sp. P9_31]|uniref:hypothetical protein n=1 Tax=Pseudomonas sp. P9_31 TaxID=3043448 RepID=UPI002A36401F|nr:hypothetical protein [Pseudomonas sp. P9_31]WPN60546.1 hypothetical protein QMK51_13510 [Pseudomonas sp. P9_31]
MSETDEIIREFALQRIANIFNIPVDSLNKEAVFGNDLKASRPPGLFNPNEYDKAEGDILDVCDRETYKAISSGNLTIRTIGDYCDHMIKCHKKKPKDVIQTLKITPPS